MIPKTDNSTTLLGLTAIGLLAAGSSAIAGAGLRQPRGWPRSLAAALIFWSASTIGMETLGMVGAIAAGPILAWSAIVAAVGAACRLIRGPGPVAPRLLDEGPIGWTATIGLGLLLSVGLLFGIPSMLSAVKVVSDGPIYHLYFAARWWKAGRLFLVASPFGENAATYFPANGDLWFTWLMAVWGGDTLAKVGQVPFLLVALASAMGCARLLGASRTSSIVAACCFASCTPLLLFSFEPNVDTIFVAGYLLSAYFFLRYAIAAGGIPALILGALAAGEALGTKPTAIVFVPPMLAVAMAGLLLGRGRLRDRIGRVAIVAIVPLATGGFWFLRDAWLTGNPLYPLNVSLMGHTMLSGWYGPEAMRASQYYLAPGRLGALADTVLAILDPRMAPLWLAAVVGAWAIRNPQTRPVRGWIVLFAIGAVANVGLYWCAIPYRTQQRFMLQAIGLAVVPLAATLDRSRWLRVVAVAMLGLHLLTPQTWPIAGIESEIPWDLDRQIPNAVGSMIAAFPRIEPRAQVPGRPVEVPAVRILVLLMILVAILTVRAWQRAPSGWIVVAVAMTGAFLGLGYAEVGGRALEPMFRSYPPFRDFYAGWRAFDTACGPRGARVAYAGTNIPYYLLGQGLRNEVRYVNIDAHRGWLLHDYHRDARARGAGLWPNSRPGWDRIHPDYDAWLANLDAEGIQLLVVTRVNPTEGVHNVDDAEGFPIERRWADDHPERFHPLYGREERDPWFRLYRVIPPHGPR